MGKAEPVTAKDATILQRCLARALRRATERQRALVRLERAENRDRWQRVRSR